MMGLPQIVLLCDKFIEKTAFGKKATDGDKAAKREMSGIMFVNTIAQSIVAPIRIELTTKYARKYNLCPVRNGIEKLIHTLPCIASTKSTGTPAELGNQQDLLLTESNEDNIKIDEKQEDEDNENNEEEQ